MNRVMTDEELNALSPLDLTKFKDYSTLLDLVKPHCIDDETFMMFTTMLAEFMLEFYKDNAERQLGMNFYNAGWGREGVILPAQVIVLLDTATSEEIKGLMFGLDHSSRVILSTEFLEMSRIRANTVPDKKNLN